MKKTVSLFLAFIMLFSCISANITGYAAKGYAEDKIEQIQKTSGFVPGKRAYVTGNCYAFVSAVCQRLFGVKYQEGLYNGYRCRHQTGLFNEVAYITTSSSFNSSNINKIINFFVNNAMPGDVVHYGSLSNSSSTHTFMIMSIDNERMKIFHSNYGSDNCRVDTIYWDSFRKHPTTNVNKSGDYVSMNSSSLYSFNSLFYQKMRYSGMGVSINRYAKYENLYYSTGASSSIPPVVTSSRSSTTSIKLAWNNISGATKYQVEYKQSSDKKYKVYTNSCAATSCDVKGLTTGAKYNFRVRAYAGGKWRGYSKTVTNDVKPPTASGIRISPEDKSLSVKWGRRSDITGVRLYKSNKSDGKFKLVKTFKNNVGSYEDRDIKYGGEYYYKVERYVISNKKEYSTTSKAVKGEYVLAAPTMFVDNVSPDSVHVTVNGDGNQSEFVYKLERNSKTVKEGSVKEKEFTLDDLTVGDKYTLKVAEKTSVGKGEYTDVDFQAIPKEVSNLKAKLVYDGITVSFDRQEGVDGYRIYRSEKKSSGFYTVATLGEKGSSYTDKTIKANKAYYYRVKSIKRRGNKEYLSKSFTATEPLTYTIAKSTKVTALRQTPNSVYLKWNKVKNAETYSIQYKEENGKWLTVNNVKGSSMELKNLRLGSYYYIKIKANNKLGSGSYTSQVKIRVLPPTPEKASTKSENKGVRVSYKTKSYASGYMVYRASSENGSYKRIATVKGTKTKSYKDRNVKKGKKYYYKIACYKNNKGKTYQSSKSKAAKQKY